MNTLLKGGPCIYINVYKVQLHEYPLKGFKERIYTRVIWEQIIYKQLSRGLNLWIFHVCISAPTPLYADYRSTISLAANPQFHEWTTHIEVDHHFIREHYEDGIITLPHVPSKQRLADLFT